MPCIGIPSVTAKKFLRSLHLQGDKSSNMGRRGLDKRFQPFPDSVMI